MDALGAASDLWIPLKQSDRPLCLNRRSITAHKIRRPLNFVTGTGRRGALCSWCPKAFDYKNAIPYVAQGLEVN